ncbi:MAG TPA: hypothetical protein VNZ52_15435 [Candidatus Thermoplasmatota archaeon]|nr:hypothetical protein [Candidatus Thermoplasmatota archaeon]
MGPATRALLLLLLVVPAASLSGCFLFGGDTTEGATGEGGNPPPTTATALRVSRDVHLDLTGVSSGASASTVLLDRLSVVYTLHAGATDLPTAGLAVVYMNRSGGLTTLPLSTLAGATLRAGATIQLPDPEPFTNVALVQAGKTVYERVSYDPVPTAGKFTGLGFSGSPGTAAYSLDVQTKGARLLFNSTLPGAENGPRYDAIGETVSTRQEGTLTLGYRGASPGNLSYTLALRTVPNGDPALVLVMNDASEEANVSAGIEIRNLDLRSTLEAALEPETSGRLKALTILGGGSTTNADVTAWYKGPADPAAPPPCYGKAREDRCRLDALYEKHDGSAAIPSTTRLSPAAYASPQGEESLLTALLGRTLVPGDHVSLRIVHPATGAEAARAVRHDLTVLPAERVTVPAGTYDALKIVWRETATGLNTTRTAWITPGTHLLVKVEREGPSPTSLGADGLLPRLSLLGTLDAARSKMTLNLTSLEGAPAQSPGLALLLAANADGLPGFHAPFLSLGALLSAAQPLTGLPPGPPNRPEVRLEYGARLGDVAAYQVAGATSGLRYADLEASLDGLLLTYRASGGSPAMGAWIALRNGAPLDRSEPLQAGDEIRIRPEPGYKLQGATFVLSLAVNGAAVFVDSGVA